MKVFCVCKNVSPAMMNDHTLMVYLGTSLDEAITSVGDFTKYEKVGLPQFPQQYLDMYTSLPQGMPWKLVKFYKDGNGWGLWYSIVEIEL